MKLNAILVVPALLSALLLTACGQKSEDATEVAPAPAAESTPAEVAPAAEAAPAASGAGGYEPTPEERVPGITLDAAATEAAAPAEAAPAEEAAPEAN
jgi:hypothetical protein